MTALWQIAAGILIVFGALPGLYLASRGAPAARLVGLQLAGVTTVLILTALALADGQSSYLIVPLTLSILLVTGTLVFTRLIRQHAHGARDAGEPRDAPEAGHAAGPHHSEEQR